MEEGGTRLNRIRLGRPFHFIVIVRYRFAKKQWERLFNGCLAPVSLLLGDQQLVDNLIQLIFNDCKTFGLGCQGLKPAIAGHD